MLKQQHRHIINNTVIAVVAIVIMAVLIMMLVPRTLRPVAVDTNANYTAGKAMVGHPLTEEAKALREQYEPNYSVEP